MCKKLASSFFRGFLVCCILRPCDFSSIYIRKVLDTFLFQSRGFSQGSKPHGPVRLNEGQEISIASRGNVVLEIDKPVVITYYSFFKAIQPWRLKVKSEYSQHAMPTYTGFLDFIIPGDEALGEATNFISPLSDSRKFTKAGLICSFAVTLPKVLI